MNVSLFTKYAVLGAAFAYVSAAPAPTELSSIGGSSIGSALAVNDKGDVVGRSYTASFEQHSTLWPAAGAAQDLGAVAGGSMSEADAVSSTGVIVGASNNADGAYRAARWASSTSPAVDLGTLGGTNSQAASVNANGDIAGYSYVAGDATLHATLWPAGSIAIVDLGTLPGGSYSQAYGINAAGDIVGNSDDASWIGHAVLWSAPSHTPTALATLGGMYGQAYAINDNGDIVGYSQNASGVFRPTLWAAPSHSPVDIGTLGGTYGGALAISNNGDIVGYSGTLNDVERHATLWRSATATGGVPGSSGCSKLNNSRGRNDRNGENRGRNERDDRGRRRLGAASSVLSFASLVSPAPAGALTIVDLGVLPGGSLSQATGVNSKGQVVGFGTNSISENRAMFWNVGAVAPAPGGGGTPSADDDEHGDHQGNHEHQDCDDGNRNDRRG